MRLWSAMLMLSALLALGNIAIAAPMDPNNHGLYGHDSFYPYPQPTQNDAVHHWHGYDNTAPGYHAPTRFAGSSHPSSGQTSEYDPYRGHVPSMNHDPWGPAHSSALRQSAWPHWMPLPAHDPPADQTGHVNMRGVDLNEALDPEFDEEQPYEAGLDPSHNEIQHASSQARAQSQSNPSVHGARHLSSEAADGSGLTYETWSNMMKRVQATRRSRLWWPEPSSLQRLAFLQPLTDKRQVRTDLQDKDQAVRRRINAMFNDKINWVELDQVPGLATSLRKRYPFAKNKPHRQLPLVVDPPPGDKNAPVHIHITEHGAMLSGPRAYGNRGTILEAKPHYMFWGIQQDGGTARGLSYPSLSRKVYYYGTGYINKADNDAVDQRLNPLIDEAEALARAHR